MAAGIVRIDQRTEPSNLTARILKFLLLLLAPALLASCGSEEEVPQQTTSDTSTISPATARRELVMMVEDRQRERNILDSVVALSGWQSAEAEAAQTRCRLADSVNMERLDAFVTQFGWPGRTMVGEEASAAAFLIVQNADLATQERYLAILAPEIETGEAAPPMLAMLQDRVLMRQRKEQIYGTQLWNDPSTGQLGLYPIQDSAEVNERRAGIGLGSLEDYLRDLGIAPGDLTPSSPPPLEITIGGDSGSTQ